MKGKVLELAASLGAAVESGPGFSGYFEVTVDAPDGYHWKGDGVHQLVSEVETGQSAAAWADALERMKDGLEPCDPNDENCRDVGFAMEVFQIAAELSRHKD